MSAAEHCAPSGGRHASCWAGLSVGHSADCADHQGKRQLICQSAPPVPTLTKSRRQPSKPTCVRSHSIHSAARNRQMAQAHWVGQHKPEGQVYICSQHKRGASKPCTARTLQVALHKLLRVVDVGCRCKDVAAGPVAAAAEVGVVTWQEQRGFASSMHGGLAWC